MLRRYKPIRRFFPSDTCRDLPEPAEHMLVNRFIPVEKAGAAECHRASVTENLPLPLRCLYRECRTSTIYQLAFDEAAIDVIKGQCLKADYFGHLFPRSQKVNGPCCRYSDIGHIDYRHAADA